MTRNTLKLELSGFKELLTKLDKLGGDMPRITEEALTLGAEKITKDTFEGLQDANLPAGGDYSRGDTKESVVSNPRVEWEGTTASVGVGFDFGKPGAGGYLIKGRYRVNTKRGPIVNHMAFAAKLNMVYTGKYYMRGVQRRIGDVVRDEIKKKMR